MDTDPFPDIVQLAQCDARRVLRSVAFLGQLHQHEADEMVAGVLPVHIIDQGHVHQLVEVLADPAIAGECAKFGDGNQRLVVRANDMILVVLRHVQIVTAAEDDVKRIDFAFDMLEGIIL